MLSSNTCLQDILDEETKEEILHDFGDIISSYGLTIKDLLNTKISYILRNFSAGYQELRIFYDSEKTLETKRYVQDFIHILLSLHSNTYKETRADKQMRPYQSRFILDILKFISQSKIQTGYIHSATSTGKTIVYSEVARYINQLCPDNKILIVVSGDNALQRAKQEFKELGIDIGVYSSKKRTLQGGINLISRQALNRSGKDIIQPESVSLMFCDEIHDGFLGEVSSDVLQRFPCKKVGCTATPELRNKHVNTLFREKIGEYCIEEAQSDGYLPEINTDSTIEIDDTSFDFLEKAGDDYTGKSLNDFKIDAVFQQVYEYFTHGNGVGKQFAIFMPSVASSQRLEKFLSERNINIAHLDGTSKNTQETKAKFENKEIQIITSCDKMSQSWDSDVIQGAMILRPTLSPAKYFQMLGRALHGKDIIDGKKIPKKEIDIVDLVNSHDSMKYRSITASGVNRVIHNSKKTGNVKSRENISIISGKSIREITMYYDFVETINPTYIKKILNKFRTKLGVSKEIFFDNLENNRNHYDSITDKLININFIINSTLGSTYSGGERTLNLSLGVFLHLVKNYKPKLKIDFIHTDTSLDFDEDHYRFWSLVYNPYTIKSLKKKIDGYPLTQHLLHIYDNLLTQDEKDEVGLEGTFITKAIAYRILYQLSWHFVESRGNAYIGKLKDEIQKGTIDITTKDSVFKNDIVTLKRVNIDKIKYLGIENPLKEGKSGLPYIDIISSLPLEFLQNVNLNKKSLDKYDVTHIIIAFYTYVGFIVKDESEKYNDKNDSVLDDISDMTFAENFVHTLVSHLNIGVDVLDGKIKLIDTTFLQTHRDVKFHSKKDEKYINLKYNDFLDYFSKIIESKEIDTEVMDFLKSRFIMGKWTSSQVSYYQKRKGETSDHLESLLKIFFKKYDIPVLGKEEADVSKNLLKNMVLGEDSLNTIQKLIGYTYDDTIKSYIYDSSKLTNVEYSGFFKLLLTTKNLQKNLPLYLQQEVRDVINGKYPWNKSEIIEPLFDFIDMPLRDVSIYPLHHQEYKKFLFSEQWNDFKEQQKIKITQRKVIPGEKKNILHRKIIDISAVNDTLVNEGANRLLKMLQYIYDDFTSEEKVSLGVKNKKVRKKDIQDIFTLFFEKTNISYKNKATRKENTTPEYFFSKLGILELEDTGIIFNHTEKIIDISSVHGTFKNMINSYKGLLFFRKLKDVLYLDKDYKDVFSEKKTAKELAVIILTTIYQKKGWKVIYNPPEN